MAAKKQRSGEGIQANVNNFMNKISFGLFKGGAQEQNVNQRSVDEKFAHLCS